jgi:hypothetical protein
LQYVLQYDFAAMIAIHHSTGCEAAERQYQKLADDTAQQ